MDLQRLRSETALDHERVEALVPVTSPDLTLQQYRAILVRFYGFIHGWEAWADLHAPHDLRPILAGRRRSTLLQQDLDFFGEAAPSVIVCLDLFNAPSRASFLGAMYVVEGSTLGGRYIAKEVEQRFHLQPGQGNAYFSGYGEQTGTMWRQFQALLQALPEADAGAVISAARQMFTEFGDWMRPFAAGIALEEALAEQEEHA